MPILLDLIDYKCYNELKNSKTYAGNISDTTPNLVANVGEGINIKGTFGMAIYSAVTGDEYWDVDYPIRGAGQTFRIYRNSGSFLEDGIRAGDIVTYYAGFNLLKYNAAVPAQRLEVKFISDDGLFLSAVVVLVLGGNPGGVETNEGIVVDFSQPQSQNKTLLLKFGLIENNENFNFISKVSGNDQIFYTRDTFSISTDAIPLGNYRDWVTGSFGAASFFDNSEQLSRQIVSFAHNFIVTPWFTSDLLENLQNGTVPELLAGENSLKYAFEAEVRKSLTDVSSRKIKTVDNVLGSVGWFGENFNGFNDFYSVESIAYENADTAETLDAVSISGRTKITVTVIKNTGSMTSDFNAGIYFSYLPDNEDEYTNTLSSAVENFIYKREILTYPATVEGDLSGAIVGGKLILTWILEFTTLEKLKLTTDNNYLLWVQVEDRTLTAGDSDRVALIADLKQFVDVNFVADFLNFERFNYLAHHQNLGSDPGSSSVEAINEDGLLIDSRFSLVKANAVSIDSAALKLVAYNASTNTYFELDSYSFDLSGAVSVGGFQEFDIDTTRNYELADGDQFNLSVFKSDGDDGTNRFIKVNVGQKVSWQDWQQNFDADPVFYDETKPNSNLNNKASNYSGVNDYQIKTILVFQLSGVDDIGRAVSGEFVHLGGNVSTLDYTLSGSPEGTIDTLDPDTLISLGGAVLYNGKDTIFRATFNDVMDLDYAIARAEVANSAGDGIFELSSIRSRPDNNLLKPLPGDDFLRVTTGVNTVIECLIDSLQLKDGVNYKLSARIASIPPKPFIYRVTVSAGQTVALPMFSANDALYNFSVNFGDGTGDFAISTYADPNRQHFYVSAGTYTITISGVFAYILFQDDLTSLVEVVDFGTSEVGLSSFANTNFNLISAPEPPAISNNSLESTFQNASAFNQPLNSWDVSGVNTLDQTFNNAVNFNQPLNLWDVSSVNNFFLTFGAAGSMAFNQPLNSWNVSNGIDFSRMFDGAANFNQPLNSWNVSNGSDFSLMFSRCAAFNGDITSWNVIGGSNFASMFSGAAAFNQNIGAWNMSNATNISSMFLGASSFNQNINSWNVAGVTSLFRTFKNASTFNQPLNSWDTSSVTSLLETFNNAISFNQNIDSWDVSNVTTFFLTFGAASSMAFDQPLNSWNVSSGIDFSRMFDGASNFNQPLNSWNVSNGINFSSMFSRCAAFNGNITSWDVSGGILFNSMFAGAAAFNQDIGGWNTASATNFSFMFSGAVAFDQNIGGWNVTNLTNASNMFLGAGLSTANYDALLIGWEAQAVQNNVSFSAGNSVHSLGGAAEDAKDRLINDHNWVITDGN